VSKYLGAPSVTPPIHLRKSGATPARPPHLLPAAALPSLAREREPGICTRSPRHMYRRPHPPQAARVASAPAMPRPQRRRRHAAAVYGLRIVPRSRDATRHLFALPPRHLPGRPVSSYPALSRLFNVRRPREPVIILLSRTLLAAAALLRARVLVVELPRQRVVVVRPERYTRFSVAPEFPRRFG
jgi:hypothetical protein